MTALIAFYWYGLLLSLGIGLVTGWWLWGQPAVAAAIEFDPYEELIEWPNAETLPYAVSRRPRAAVTSQAAVDNPAEAENARPPVEEDIPEAEIEPKAEPAVPETFGALDDTPASQDVVALAQVEDEGGQRLAEDQAADEAEQPGDAPSDEPEAVVTTASPPEDVPIALDAPQQTAEPDKAPDDLLMIKGIGPQLVRLLNGLGVHRFDDIASWMPEDIEMINSHLGQFRGAIIRDEWIQQARLLARGDMENFRQRYGHLR